MVPEPCQFTSLLMQITFKHKKIIYFEPDKYSYLNPEAYRWKSDMQQK